MNLRTFFLATLGVFLLANTVGWGMWLISVDTPDVVWHQAFGGELIAVTVAIFIGGLAAAEDLL